MVTKWVAGAAMAVMALSLAACGKGVDGKAIASPPAGEWLGHGRDYFEQRFSPRTRSAPPTSRTWAWPGTSTSATARGWSPPDHP